MIFPPKICLFLHKYLSSKYTQEIEISRLFVGTIMKMKWINTKILKKSVYKNQDNCDYVYFIDSSVPLLLTQAVLAVEIPLSYGMRI